ncbi:nitroreductase family deazaflavin-dependent oxidoreductase [Streptosporangium canum]|uniref:nitroreductase family deazaflavin-dependent oxidoreductase n=1 Tax=Streptosporangium canum TaxID=324952 RepID=UPI0036BE4FAC
MGRRLIGLLRPFFQWLAGTDAFARFGPKIVPRLDRAVHRLSRGRAVMSDQMIPTLVLTTVGAKSGELRAAPLACLPEDGGGFLVVGSNFGRAHHPGWSGNLLRTPKATVSFRGREIPVTGRLLSGPERAEAWPRLLRIWPVYDRYSEKSGRELRVFRLSPRSRP